MLSSSLEEKIEKKVVCNKVLLYYMTCYYDQIADRNIAVMLAIFDLIIMSSDFAT